MKVIQLHGISMRPLFTHGDYLVISDPKDDHTFQDGELYLYQDKNRLVLHRYHIGLGLKGDRSKEVDVSAEKISHVNLIGIPVKNFEGGKRVIFKFLNFFICTAARHNYHANPRLIQKFSVAILEIFSPFVRRNYSLNFEGLKLNDVATKKRIQ